MSSLATKEPVVDATTLSKYRRGVSSLWQEKAVVVESLSQPPLRRTRTAQNLDSAKAASVLNPKDLKAKPEGRRFWRSKKTKQRKQALGKDVQATEPSFAGEGALAEEVGLQFCFPRSPLTMVLKIVQQCLVDLVDHFCSQVADFRQKLKIQDSKVGCVEGESQGELSSADVLQLVSGLKTSSNFSGSMPMPLSLTVISTAPSRVRPRISTRGLASVRRNFTALLMRFWKTWVRS